jgi:RNA polymerase sigma factor (sigma-70 family)
MNPQQEQLFAEHHELLEKAARCVHSKYGNVNGLTRDDYRQYAAIGLLRAVKEYRPSKGAFTHFAWKRVKGAILDGIREVDEVGRSRRVDGIKGPCSLESRGADDGERLGLLRERLPARRTADVTAGFEQIEELLSGLQREVRVVVYLSVISELSAWQIGCVLGVSGEYVSMLLDSGMERLRKTHQAPARTPAAHVNQLDLFWDGASNGTATDGADARRA